MLMLSSLFSLSFATASVILFVPEPAFIRAETTQISFLLAMEVTSDPQQVEFPALCLHPVLVTRA